MKITLNVMIRADLLFQPIFSPFASNLVAYRTEIDGLLKHADSTSLNY